MQLCCQALCLNDQEYQDRNKSDRARHVRRNGELPKVPAEMSFGRALRKLPDSDWGRLFLPINGGHVRGTRLKPFFAHASILLENFPKTV